MNELALPAPKPPSPATLRRYGLTTDEYLSIAARQGNVCAVCGKLAPRGTLDIDHEHVKGWKKLPPAQRRRFVRGLLCRYDNMRMVAKGMTAEKARRIWLYLESYGVRFAGEPANNQDLSGSGKSASST